MKIAKIPTFYMLETVFLRQLKLWPISILRKQRDKLGFAENEKVKVVIWRNMAKEGSIY